MLSKIMEIEFDFAMRLCHISVYFRLNFFYILENLFIVNMNYVNQN